jgi:hypothetical protein
MVEQLFTATGEEKNSEKERGEQLFTARREKTGSGKGDRDRERRQRQRKETVTEMEEIGALKGRFYPEKGRGVISPKKRLAIEFCHCEEP